LVRLRHFGWAIFILVVTSFFGGLIGGFLGVGVLDDMLFTSQDNEEVILQESSVVTNVAQELRPSVVSIETKKPPRFDVFGREFERRSGSATGVVVSGEGIVLTNKHVVPQESEITIRNHQGATYEDVEVIDRDPINDIAFLQINTDQDLQPAELGDSGQVEVGQRVIAIGNALGEFSNTVTSGIISGLGRPVTAADTGSQVAQLQGLLQTDAAINQGNSGGPLVDIAGQVIGINTAIAGNAENIGFAIPVNQVKSGLESVQQEGRIIKPFLGVRYIMVNQQVVQRADLDVSQGAYLPQDGKPSVISGSPADKAGIKPGDVITAIGGEKISRQDNNLALLINQREVGEAVQVSLVRDGEEQTLEVTLEEAPQDL
jgi:serine protease Do